MARESEVRSKHAQSAGTKQGWVRRKQRAEAKEKVIRAAVAYADALPGEDSTESDALVDAVIEMEDAFRG